MEKKHYHINKLKLKEKFRSLVCLLLMLLFGFSQIFGWSGLDRTDNIQVVETDHQYFISGESSSSSSGSLFIQLFKDLADSDRDVENEDDNFLTREGWYPTEMQKSSADHVRFYQQNCLRNNRNILSLFILFQSWKGLL